MTSASRSEDGDERRKREDCKWYGQEPYGNLLGGEVVDHWGGSSNVGRWRDGIKIRCGEVYQAGPGDEETDDGRGDAPKTLRTQACPAQETDEPRCAEEPDRSPDDDPEIRCPETLRVEHALNDKYVRGGNYPRGGGGANNG